MLMNLRCTHTITTNVATRSKRVGAAAVWAKSFRTCECCNGGNGHGKGESGKETHDEVFGVLAVKKV